MSLGHFAARTVHSVAGARTLAVAAALVLSLSFVAAPQQRARASRVQEVLAREIRHELVMLPYYGVFDNLGFRVDGPVVELYGQVTRPTLKSDAERVVQRIEGVEKLVNNIEVLPVSPNDDRI